MERTQELGCLLENDFNNLLMKTRYILIVLLLFTLMVHAQGRKLRFPVWVFNTENTDIVGVSLGASPKTMFNDTTLTRTYGLRIDVSPLGILGPLMPRSPVSTTVKAYQASMDMNILEVVNGVNLSTGSYFFNSNGLSAGLLLQYSIKMNGISVSGISNLIERQNGLVMALLSNDVFQSNGLSMSVGNHAHRLNGAQIGVFNDVVGRGHGIQIGLFNKATSFRGIQLGFWNKNSKRSLPFINWQFSE